MRPKAWLSWSSGKDSAWALHLLRQLSEYEITGLLTTFNSAFDRVAMHSTRRELVEMQARAAGIPLISVPLPWPCSNVEYERIMKGVCAQAVVQGVTAIVFGDLFLADIRAYRERQLQGTGLKPLFPLWQLPTLELAREMIASGLRAKLVCVDPNRLAPEFVGRDFDLQLLADLPPEADPCGENGEFHSFVYAGPMFDRPISVETGERVERDGFWFCDVMAATETATGLSLGRAK
jgi:uncharacterized protein (TIGR00290 family)